MCEPHLDIGLGTKDVRRCYEATGITVYSSVRIETHLLDQRTRKVMKNRPRCSTSAWTVSVSLHDTERVAKYITPPKGPDDYKQEQNSGYTKSNKYSRSKSISKNDNTNHAMQDFGHHTSPYLSSPSHKIQYSNVAYAVEVLISVVISCTPRPLAISCALYHHD